MKYLNRINRVRLNDGFHCSNFTCKNVVSKGDRVYIYDNTNNNRGYVQGEPWLCTDCHISLGGTLDTLDPPSKEAEKLMEYAKLADDEPVDAEHLAISYELADIVQCCLNKDENGFLYSFINEDEDYQIVSKEVDKTLKVGDKVRLIFNKDNKDFIKWEVIKDES